MASTVAEAGVTESVAEATVIVALAVLVESSKEVAVRVTLASLAGGVDGAV